MPAPNKDDLQKIREDFKTEGSTATASAEKKDEVIAPAEKVIEQPQAKNLDDLTSEEILALAEKKGLKISKETLSPEQEKRAAEIEEVEKLKFAVENNLITQEGYQEAKAILQAEGGDLTKKEFIKAYKSDNPKATKEETESAYDDYYFVQKNITVKEKQLKKDGEFEEEVEVDVEKPKWDEQFVKWGESRRNTKAQRIKDGAKAILDNIDSSYSNYKTVLNRANEYSKTIEKAISETDFTAYPTNHKVKGKDISATVRFEKPEEVKASVQKYLTEELAPLIIRAEKQSDIAEVKKQINGYLKEKYSGDFEDTLWDLGKTAGINEAKVGSSAPIEREIVSDDTRVDELSKSIEARLPKNPLIKPR